MSWDELGKPGEPVRGSIGDFESAIAQWRAASGRASEILGHFDQVASGGDFGLDGQAATALTSLVTDARKVIADVPTVFDSLVGALEGHVKVLISLRGAADQALTEGLGAKAARAEAARNSAAAGKQTEELRRQIMGLQGQPEQSGAVASLESQLRDADRRHVTHRQTAEHQQTKLKNSLDSWQILRDQEDVLNRATAERLRGLDLKSLRNPNLVSQVGSAFTESWRDVANTWDTVWPAVKESVVAAVRAIPKIAEAEYHLLGDVFRGDWEQALWDLHDYLEAWSEAAPLLITVVGLAAAPFTGGESLLAIEYIPHVVAAFGLSNAVVETVILAKGSRSRRDPEATMTTGQVVSDLGFVGLDAIAGYTPAKHVGQLATYNTTRAALSEGGIVLKHGYEISAKKTAVGLVEHSFTEQVKSTVNDGSKAAFSALVDSHFGRIDKTDTRFSEIETGLAQLQQPGRPLSVSLTLVGIDATY